MELEAAPWPGTRQIDQEFAAITEFWSPRVVAAANGQLVKLAKASGELVWHAHAEEDEFFLCQRGTFGLRYRDGREILLGPGEFHVVPKGVEHLPFTIGGEAWIMLIEPAATRHTGDIVSERTRTLAEQIAHLR